MQSAQGIPTQGFKTTSPQGDGNFGQTDESLSSGPLFQNHIPARGRKLDHPLAFEEPRIISKPYPRKGTETLLLPQLWR